jgi:hypothetical protein
MDKTKRLEDFLITDQEKTLLILSKILNPNNDMFIMELKKCFELDFVINSLDTITIKDIYEFANKNKKLEKINETNKKHKIQKKDKKIIEDLIIKYISNYNNDNGVMFKDICDHVEKNFINYSIPWNNILALLKELKNKAILDYINIDKKKKTGKWIKHINSDVELI